MAIDTMLYFLDLNECTEEGGVHSNGGCSHVCINKDGSYRCSCRTGYVLSSDLHFCKGKLETCQYIYTKLMFLK